MRANHLIVNLIDVYEIILIIRIVLSWIPHNRDHPLVEFLYRITEPVLSQARRIIPPIGGTLDVSPIVVFVALEFLKRLFMGA